MNSINKKYQSLLLRVLKADRKLSDLIDSNHRVMDDVCCDDPKYYRLEQKHSNAEWKAQGKLNELFEELPKREQANFNKQYKAQYGYNCYAFYAL